METKHEKLKSGEISSERFVREIRNMTKINNRRDLDFYVYYDDYNQNICVLEACFYQPREAIKYCKSQDKSKYRKYFVFNDSEGKVIYE